MSWAMTAQADQRIALVIGNNAYEFASPLVNARGDAETLSDTLSKLDFDVVEQFDADLTATGRAVDQFVVRAKDAEIAVVYFSGHGVELFGKNYLLPVDVDPNQVDEPKDLGINLTRLSDRLEAAGVPRFILIVDACRNSPFAPEQEIDLASNAARILHVEDASAAKSGLARGLTRLDVSRGSDEQASDKIVMFAAQSGAVAQDGTGDHSPFAQALVAFIGSEDVEITQTFFDIAKYVTETTGGAQRPEMQMTWSSPYYLVPGDAQRHQFRYLFPMTVGDRLQEQTYTEHHEKLRDFYGDPQYLPAELRPKGRMLFPPVMGRDHSERAAESGYDPKSIGLGNPYGFRLKANLDGDAADEEILVRIKESPWAGISRVEVGVRDAGVTYIFQGCDLQRQLANFDAHPFELEVGVHDANGDRRPDIWVAKGVVWGDLCVFSFMGGRPRLYGSADDVYDDAVFQSLIWDDVGWGVRILPGNYVEICGGTGCNDRTLYYWKGDYLEVIEGVVSGRERNSPPHKESSGDFRKRLLKFIREVYLGDGVDDYLGNRSIYANEVSYYGKKLARSQVLKDKEDYYRRWTQRRMTFDGGVDYQRDGNSIKVDFEFSYQVSNQARSSDGRGTVNLELLDEGDGFHILSESSRLHP